MHWAKRCFDSLQRSTIIPDVFVVDNGSTDGTQSFIQKNYSNIIFQQSKENLGFGMANNLGLKYALENNYDYIYLLNQDAWVQPDTFEKLIQISVNNSDFGIISPIQMNADLYHIDKSFCIGLFNYKNKDYINDLHNGKLKEIYQTTPFIMAAHWFLTKQCISKVGGFSPTFKHYGEDNNFADRVIYHGFKIGVAPLLKVVHDRGERTDKSDKSMYLYSVYYRVKISNPLENKIVLALIKLAMLCLKYSMEYKSVKPIIYYITGLFNIPSMLKNKKKSMITDCAFLRNV